MANAITIDSNVLESIISSVGSDKSKMEEVKSSLDSTCAPLTACGLFENCLSSLKEEASNIIATYDALQTSLKSHINDVSSLEDRVQKVGSDYRSYYTPSGGGGGYRQSQGDDSKVEEVDDGKKVDPEKMESKIDELKISSISSMIAFAMIIKEKDTSLMELLFDPTKAGKFAEILKKFYSTYGTLEVNYDDASKVQKAFIKKILNDNENLPSNITEGTLIAYKKYLVNIAKANNTTPEDLLLDNKYKDVLTTSLKKLYEGDVDKKEYDDEYIVEFKAFINMKASTKNLKTDEVLSDIKNML